MPRTAALAAVAGLLAATVLASGPTDTAFTSEGRRTQSGLRVNGTADFRFKLFDASSGGASLCPSLALDGASINRRSLTVDLDFGAALFEGSGRCLEVDVGVPAGDGIVAEPAFTTLNPRQGIKPTPYAIYALNSAVGPQGPQGDATVCPHRTRPTATCTSTAFRSTKTPTSNANSRGAHT